MEGGEIHRLGVLDPRHDQRPATVFPFDVHGEPKIDRTRIHAVWLAVDLLEVVRHHGEALGGLDDPVPDQVGERDLFPTRGELGIESLAARVERGSRDVAERGRRGDGQRLGHILNQPRGGAGDRNRTWRSREHGAWSRKCDWRRCRRRCYLLRGPCSGDNRQLRELSVLKELPPLLAHRVGVAEVLLVHSLYEGGVVGAEHGFTHGLESIRYLISQYAVATSSLTHEPERFESRIPGQGPHR